MAVTEFDTDNDLVRWFARRYIQGDVNTDTVHKRVGQLNDFAEWYDGDLTTVDPIDVEDYFTSKRGFASTTLSSYRYALVEFYDDLTDGGKVESDPMDPIPKQVVRATNGDTEKERQSDDNERIHPLDPDEIRQLVENVPSPTVRNKLLIRLMAQTGVRAHEAAKITFDRLDRDERKIKIVSDKTESSRKVAYQESLIPPLRLWIDKHRGVFKSARDSDYLFVSREKEKMNHNNINQVVTKAAENAGLQETLYVDAAGGERKKVTSHSLRHSFAVNALSPDVSGGSMNLAYIRDVMGHEDIEVTQDYLKFVETDALRDMRRKVPTCIN